MTTEEKRPLPGCCVDRVYSERHPEVRGPKGCNGATCMTLPDGSTCKDCVRFESCQRMFGCKPENRSCDFFPRRFLERGDRADAPSA